MKKFKITLKMLDEYLPMETHATDELHAMELFDHAYADGRIVRKSRTTLDRHIKEIKEEEKLKSVNIIQCPLCSEMIEHKEGGKTHIWSCGHCAFIGFEFEQNSNIADLINFVN